MISLLRPGRSFLIDNLAWSSALVIAERHGWCPAGTMAPPVSISRSQLEKWTGGYLIAAGQEVLKEDAQRFAEALSKTRLQEFAALSEFCRTAGFVIAPNVAQYRSPADHRYLHAELDSAESFSGSCKVRR